MKMKKPTLTQLVKKYAPEGYIVEREEVTFRPYVLATFVTLFAAAFAGTGVAGVANHEGMDMPLAFAIGGLWGL